MGMVLNGNPTLHYKDALRRRLVRLLVRCNKEQQLVFNLYTEVKAILRNNDYLTLWAYLFGLNPGIIQTFENYLRPGMIVVDVGAHVGLYAIISTSMVSTTGKVYTFEPVPWLAQRLEDNARLNSMTNIKAFNMAVGAKSGKSNLYLSKCGGDEWSSLYQWRLSGNRYIEIPVITLDEFIANNNIKRIDLLKVDTEGSELDVLLGAQGALKDGVIKAILVEFNSETQMAAGFTAHDLQQSLVQYGFDWYSLPYHSHHRTQVDWSSCGELSDFIAVKRDA